MLRLKLGNLTTDFKIRQNKTKLDKTRQNSPKKVVANNFYICENIVKGDERRCLKVVLVLDKMKLKMKML